MPRKDRAKKKKLQTNYAAMNAEMSETDRIWNSEANRLSQERHRANLNANQITEIQKQVKIRN